MIAARVLAAFKHAVEAAASRPLARPEHPDIPGARHVMFDGFPYLAFYAVNGDGVVVVAVEYATREYVGRVASRVAATK